MNKYLSKYSPNKQITPNQYIVELVLENLARSKNTNLPLQFWKLPEWEKAFCRQVKAASALLKKYSDVAIVRALKTWKGQKIYSLRAPFLIPLIEEEEKKLVGKKDSQVKAVENPKFRQENYKESGPLEELDD